MGYGLLAAAGGLCRNNRTISVGHTSELMYSLQDSQDPAVPDSGPWLRSGLLPESPSPSDLQRMFFVLGAGTGLRGRAGHASLRQASASAPVLRVKANSTGKPGAPAVAQGCLTQLVSMWVRSLALLSLDPLLLWLWCRSAAAAPICPLARDLPYAQGAAQTNKPRQTQSQGGGDVPLPPRGHSKGRDMSRAAGKPSAQPEILSTTLVNFPSVISKSHPYSLNYGPREARRRKNSVMLQPSYHRSGRTDRAAEAQGDSAAGALGPARQFSIQTADPVLCSWVPGPISPDPRLAGCERMGCTHTHVCMHTADCVALWKDNASPSLSRLATVITAASLSALTLSSGRCLSSYTGRHGGGRLSIDYFPQRGHCPNLSLLCAVISGSSPLCHLIRMGQARDAVKSN